jgi:hypothetical protein
VVRTNLPTEKLNVSIVPPGRIPKFKPTPAPRVKYAHLDIMRQRKGFLRVSNVQKAVLVVLLANAETVKSEDFAPTLATQTAQHAPKARLHQRQAQTVGKFPCRTQFLDLSM